MPLLTSAIGLQVSRLCLGTVNFGMHVSQEDTFPVLDRALEQGLGLGVIPYSPMGGGLLCCVLDNPASGRRGGESLKETIETYRTQLQAYEQLCHALGQRPADVALACVLKNPDIVAPIIGPRTVEQLDQNVAALELALDGETLARLDEIFPGPSGEAPEAYAW